MSAASSILGNNTKFSTAEDFALKYGKVALRFYLLEVARAILPDERLRVCWRYPLPERKTIEIIYSQERKTARTKGTMKCGCGWVCPVCMRYIAERRRMELDKALKNSKDRYFSVMVTYTARHTQGDRLKPLLANMVKAYGKTFEGGWWQRTREEYMLQGAIRATEITYGKNGWHPHFHVIMMVDRTMLDDDYAGSPDEYAQSLQTTIGPRWISQLEKAGLMGSSRRSIDVRTADEQIAAYVAKFGKMPKEWSMQANPYEVACSTAKTPKNGNLGVLEILFQAAEQSKYKQLYKEYHTATKGRSMLQWSKGLKKDLDIEVIRDAIAAEGIETDTDIILAQINIHLWRDLSRHGYIGQIMTYANSGDAEKLEELLRTIQTTIDNEPLAWKNWEKGH